MEVVHLIYNYLAHAAIKQIMEKSGGLFRMRDTDPR